MSQLARLELFIKSFGEMEAQELKQTVSPPHIQSASHMTSASAAASSASSSSATVTKPVIGNDALFKKAKELWVKNWTVESGAYDEPWSCSGTQTWLLCWWLGVTNMAVGKYINLHRVSLDKGIQLPVTNSFSTDYFLLSGGGHDMTIIHQLGRWTLLQSWVNHFHLFPHMNVGNVDHNLYGVDYAEIRAMLTDGRRLDVQALSKPSEPASSETPSSDALRDANQPLSRNQINMPTTWAYTKIDLGTGDDARPEWLDTYDPIKHFIYT